MVNKADSSNTEMQRLPLIKKTIHTDLKSICVAKGISMQEASEQAILAWIATKEKETKKP